jgi:hypothetical protein
MYLHRPQPTWMARLFGSARTLVAIIITAMLASALTVRWSAASATSYVALPAGFNAAVTTVPVSIEGTLVGASDGLVAIVETGAETPVAFPIAETSQMVRQGQNVPLDALRAGDRVRMTIDGLTGNVLRLNAEPVTATPFQVPGTAALMAAIGLIGGATALAIRNIERLPTVSSRVATTRLLPAGAMR